MSRLCLRFAVALCFASAATFSIPHAGAAPARGRYYVVAPHDGGFMAAQQKRGEKDDWDAMIRAAEARKRSHPKDINAWFSAAYAHFKWGEVDAAERNYRQCLDMDPKRHVEFNVSLRNIADFRKRWPGLRLQRPVWVESDVDRERAVWRAKAAGLLKAKKYDQIEQAAYGMQASRRAGRDGVWDLEKFASGLWTVDEGPNAPAVWKDSQARIAAWRKARPKSMLAQIAAMASWFEGAYLARGTDTADKVSEQQFRTMNERLEGASKLMPALRLGRGKSPLVAHRFLQWAVLSGMERAEFLQIAADANAAFPTYTGFDFVTVRYLMERWHGEAGEWETYAARRADAVGGVQGDIWYARLIASQRDSFENIWKGSTADWHRAQRGCETLLKQYPDSLDWGTEYYRLAYLHYETAVSQRLMVKVLRNRAKKGAWKSLGRFSNARMNVLTLTK